MQFCKWDAQDSEDEETSLHNCHKWVRCKMNMWEWECKYIMSMCEVKYAM